MAKYFVVMKEGEDGKLYCIGREGGYSAGASTYFGYKSRQWAEKFAAKNDAGVYAVKGIEFGGLRDEADHFDLAWEAAKQFNAKKPELTT